MRADQRSSFAACAALVAAVFACQSNGQGTDPAVVQLTGAQRGEHVEVAVGDEIDIELQTVGPGEYETPAVSSDAVQFVSASQLTPPNPAGPRQLYRFEALQGGSAQVSIPHSGAADEFTVVVDVHE